MTYFITLTSRPMRTAFLTASLQAWLTALVLLSPADRLPMDFPTDASTVEWRHAAGDTTETANDSARAQAYAELVHMLGAFESFGADADSLLPNGDPLWYEWEQLPGNLSERRDSLVNTHSHRLSTIVAKHGLPPERNLSTRVETAVVRAARQYPILPDAPMIAWSATYILWRHSVDAPTQQQLLSAIIDRQIADYEGRIRYVLEMSLTDRVALRTDSMQVYGTQMCHSEGQMQYFPIKDRAFADMHRKKAEMRELDKHRRYINHEEPCSDCRPCPTWAQSQPSNDGS